MIAGALLVAWSAKRWEDPKYSDPPEEACDLLMEARQTQLAMMDFARACADALEAMGYEVEFAYPTDDGWVETPPNPA